jgi:hypothetical protein
MSGTLGFFSAGHLLQFLVGRFSVRRRVRQHNRQAVARPLQHPNPEAFRQGLAVKLLHRGAGVRECQLAEFPVLGREF